MVVHPRALGQIARHIRPQQQAQQIRPLDILLLYISGREECLADDRLLLLRDEAHTDSCDLLLRLGLLTHSLGGLMSVDICQIACT